MTKNASGSVSEQNDARENSTQPRKEWKLALIGLPDSGKSTFLARLYGANIGEGSRSGRAKYALSFPSAIAETVAEREILAKIHQLWEWIRSNFDKKLKTFDTADLIFHLSGPGLHTGIAVHTKDLPGETFNALPEIAEKIIEPERLKAIKQEVLKHYKRCSVALVLIDSHKMDEAADSALIKAILNDLPRRTRLGMPVFKLVVFTKAGTAEDFDNLKTRIAQTEKMWKAQGIKWLKVIACEALSDLEQSTHNGSIQWNLPPAGTKPPFPKWIHTPSTAILELPRMYVSYRRWRNFKLAAAAVALLGIMAGTWVYQGHRYDRNAYERAIGQPEDRRIEAIEAYLVNRGASRDNWFYPVKHRAEAASKQWNRLFFSKIDIASDLEWSRNELTRVKNDRLWKNVDREQHSQQETEITRRIADEQQRHAQAMNEWKAAAFNESQPERFIHDRRFDFPLVPSLAIETERVRGELLKIHADESKEIEAFRDLSANWRPRIAEVQARLNRLSTESHLQFHRHQDDRRHILRQFSDEIENIGVGHVPFQSNALLDLLSAAVAKQFDAAAAKEIQTRIAGIRSRTRERISALERLSADRFREFEGATEWDDKVRIANAAMNELLDIPAAKEWRSRAEEWGIKLRNSERSFDRLQQDIRRLMNNPQEQLSILRSFASESSIDHSPKHRELARRATSHISAQNQQYIAAWERVGAAWARFEQDRTALPDLRDALDAYVNLLRQHNRDVLTVHAEDHERFNQSIEGQVGAVAKLLADYNQAWASLTSPTSPVDRTRHRNELRRVILALQDTHERQANTTTRIPTYLSNVRSRVDDVLLLSGITDDEFQEALDAATLASELSQSLGRAEGRDEYDRYRTEIMTKWAEARWQSVESEANQRARQGHYKEAIDRLLAYKNSTNIPYDTFPDQAEREIQKHAGAWQVSLLHVFSGTPSIRQRADYIERNAMLRAEFNKFHEVMGDSASVELRAAFSRALADLDDALRDWYITRVNNLLSKLPLHNSRRVIATWAQLDEISKLFNEIQSDQEFRGKYRGLAERAERHYRELQSSADNREIRLGINELKLIMPSDGDYWGDKFPEPRIRLMHNDNAPWHVDIEDRKKSPATDSRRQPIHYNVGRVPGKFVLKSIEWNKLSPYTILYSKRDRLAVDIQIARQSPRIPMRLPLIESDQTPGALLSMSGSQLTTRSEVNCDPIVGKKFAMLLELEMKLDVKDDTLRVFTLPEKFE